MPIEYGDVTLKVELLNDMHYAVSCYCLCILFVRVLHTVENLHLDFSFIVPKCSLK